MRKREGRREWRDAVGQKKVLPLSMAHIAVRRIPSPPTDDVSHSFFLFSRDAGWIGANGVGVQLTAHEVWASGFLHSGVSPLPPLSVYVAIFLRPCTHTHTPILQNFPPPSPPLPGRIAVFLKKEGSAPPLSVLAVWLF